MGATERPPFIPARSYTLTSTPFGDIRRDVSNRLSTTKRFSSIFLNTVANRNRAPERTSHHSFDEIKQILKTTREETEAVLANYKVNLREWGVKKPQPVVEPRPLTAAVRDRMPAMPSLQKGVRGLLGVYRERFVREYGDVVVTPRQLLEKFAPDMLFQFPRLSQGLQPTWA